MGMYWSESWRIYAASLIFSPLIYGESYPWPWLDPARALVDGVALVFPTRSIAAFRGWIAFLILSTHFLAALVILRRAGKSSTRHDAVSCSRCGECSSCIKGQFTITSCWARF
jgi:hypothetical protein